MLELKKGKGAEYIIGWKSKFLYNSELIALYNAFLPNVNYFGNKIGIQLNNTPLVIEQINYTRKIVNVWIVYDLDNWPKNLLTNFTLENCLFGVTNIVKNSDKEKYGYSVYGIAFDWKSEWIFGLAQDVIVFGVDNSSSSHTDNLKHNFLILGEDPTIGINGRFGASGKKIDIIFSRAKTKFCLSLHYNSNNSYLFVNGKEIYKFKANNGNVNFPSGFCLESISNLHSNEYSQEFHYYLFSVKLLSNKVCLPNKAKDLNLSVSNMITEINKSKALTNDSSYKCKCKFDDKKCNSNQWWNNDKCWCECKKVHVWCEKDYIWNPSRCICEKEKYFASIMDDSIIICDKVIELYDKSKNHSNKFWWKESNL